MKSGTTSSSLPIGSGTGVRCEIGVGDGARVGIRVSLADLKEKNTYNSRSNFFPLVRGPSEIPKNH